MSFCGVKYFKEVFDFSHEVAPSLEATSTWRHMTSGLINVPNKSNNLSVLPSVFYQLMCKNPKAVFSQSGRQRNPVHFSLACVRASVSGRGYRGNYVDVCVDLLFLLLP